MVELASELDSRWAESLNHMTLLLSMHKSPLAILQAAYSSEQSLSNVWFSLLDF